MPESNDTRQEFEPSAEALALMERHLIEWHGYEDFDRARDLAAGLGSPEPAVLTWDYPRGAFHCRLCGPGRVFIAESEPSPAYLRSLLRDPALQPFLAGLYTNEERLEMARRYYAGQIGPALLASLSKRDLRSQPRQAHPQTTRHRAAAQRLMLEQYRSEGSVDAAARAIVRMQSERPAEYEAAVGPGRPYAVETLRKLWQAIPEPDRQAAREEHQQLRERRREGKPANLTG